MKRITLAITVALSTLKAGAVQSQNVKPDVSWTFDKNVCGLTRFEGGTTEFLSGFRISESWVLTAGHSLFDSAKGKIKCFGGHDSESLSLTLQRSDNYWFKDSPKNFTEWSPSDFALIKIRNPKLAPFNFNQFIFEPAITIKLIENRKCFIAGASHENLDSFEDLEPRSIELPESTKINSKILNDSGQLSHVLLSYSGQAVAFHGDSGGSLICKNSDGIFYVSGILQFAGGIEENSTHINLNALGILLLNQTVKNFISQNAK